MLFLYIFIKENVDTEKRIEVSCEIPALAIRTIAAAATKKQAEALAAERALKLATR